MKNTNAHNTYGVSLAIVAAGVLIAGAVFWSKGLSADTPSAATHQSGASFRLPSEEDHVRGNPDAKVAIVEFSDLECPFCARLHPTLARIVNENPNVKWVYRHFPLSSIHSRALGAAVASECIARLAGNEAFWAFTDAAFSNQKDLGEKFYEASATSAGIERAAFDVCVDDRAVAQKVAADNTEAISTGGQGTPFVVVVTAGGRLVPFSGALPYEQVKGIVDQALVN